MTINTRGAQARVVTNPTDSSQVLKIYDAGGRLAAEIEFTWLKTAAALGLPVPAAVGVTEDKGQGILVMEALAGVDLEATLFDVSCDPNQILDAMLRFREQLAGGSALAALADSRGPTQTSKPLVQRLRQRIPGGPDFACKPIVIELLSGLVDGEQLCHLDLHPANIMLADGDHYLIDWIDAALGPPVADAAATIVRLRSVAPPEDATEEQVLAFTANVAAIEAGFIDAVKSLEQLDEWARVLAADALVRRGGNPDVLRALIRNGL